MTTALLVDLVAGALLVAGAGFYTLGTVGLLRLPDLRTRLHALSKADNLGLGLVVLGLALQAGTVGAAAKLLLIWLLAMLSAPVVATLLAREGALTDGDAAADPREADTDGR